MTTSSDDTRLQRHGAIAPPVPTLNVPDLTVLQALPWSAGVTAAYESIFSYDAEAASKYLALQWRLDFDPTYARAVRLPAERANREKRDAILAALPLLLHPYQQPLTGDDIAHELVAYGIEWVSRPTMRYCLNKLMDAGILRRFQNPFGRGCFVYCHEMFRSEPAKGDRVVELIRHKSQRSGVVEYFKPYRMNGQMYPVVRWDATPKRLGFSSFANPDMIIVVAKPEPFASQQQEAA